MRRRAFHLVEILIAMAIMAVLTGLVLVTYRGQAERTQEVVCLDGLAKVADHIQRWQLKHRRPWYLGRVPGPLALDPWERPFRVDPVEGMIWSAGEDGEFDTPSAAGTLARSYEAYPTPAVPPVRRLTLRQTAGGGAEIRWDWPEAAAVAIRYEVARAPLPSAPFRPLAAAAPGPDPFVLDPAVPVGSTVYYRVRAALGPGSKRPYTDWSRPYAFSRVVSSAPTLEITAGSYRGATGSAIAVRLTGRPNGAPLRRLEFGGEVIAVGPGEFTLSREVTLLAGAQRLDGVLSAADGQRRAVRLTLTGE